MTRLLYIIILSVLLPLFGGSASRAETSDSIIVDVLEESGVKFTDNNKVVLLMSGQEKFDDMFKAIEQAKSSIHLEYFNFRNDSIAAELFRLLRRKAKEGVEVRALFDGFGNDSNNRQKKKKHRKIPSSPCRANFPIA